MRCHRKVYWPIEELARYDSGMSCLSKLETLASLYKF